MTDQELRIILNEVVDIAKLASKAIMDIYNREEDFGVEMKQDNSPLTKADKLSNNIICQGLESLSYKFPIVSEENAEIPYSVRKDFKYYWVVDPLDGTKEFVKRNGEFAVNIALMKGAFPLLGVVAAPAEKSIAWAIQGQGAYYEKDGLTCKLECSSFSMADRQLKIVKSRSHLSEATQAYIDQFDSPILIAKGSSFKFLMIANGDAHLYPRLGPTMEWDTAAPQIIVEESGGAMLRKDTGERMYYNKENLLNPDFLTFAKTIDG